jgi:hypothetical protein
VVGTWHGSRLPDPRAGCPARPGSRPAPLFGSNHPARLPAADCLSGLASLGLDDEATELLLHGNADRVFDLATIPGSVLNLLAARER